MNTVHTLLDAKIGQAAPAAPTVTLLRRIIDLVKAGHTSHEVSATVGLDEARTVALVGEVGTWLSQVFTKPDPDAVVSVVVPAGFDRQPKTRRDVSPSVRSIVFHDPSDEVLARFINRRYRTKDPVVTPLTLSTVHLFAQLGRLDDLVDVSDDVAFLTALRDSLDLLEQARLDALVAWDVIVTEPDDRDAVTAAVLRAEWSSPVELRRLLFALRTATDDRLWRRELGLLARRVRQDPSRYRPDAIARLSYGQVVMIAAAYGVVDGSEEIERRRREARERLSAVGFASDLDKMLPDWERAVTQGCEAQFWVTVEQQLAV
jgi:hypothetical protein